MNPVQQIPSIDDNGLHLGESCAISQYLCDKYAPDNNLYPKDVQKRAQVNRMLFFAAGTLWSTIRAYIVSVNVIFLFIYFNIKIYLKCPKSFLGVEPPKEALDQVKEKINLLNTLIGNKKYVAADHLTIADLYLYLMMGQIHNIAAEAKWDLNQFANLKKWHQTFSTEHPQLVEIGSRMDGIEELVPKLKKNLGVN